MDGETFLSSSFFFIIFKPSGIIERREIKRGVSLDWFSGRRSPTRVAGAERNQAADLTDGEAQRIERE